MTKLFKVEQAIIGGGRTETLYFRTQEQAQEWTNEHDYCNLAGTKRMRDEIAEELIARTAYYRVA